MTTPDMMSLPSVPPLSAALSAPKVASAQELPPMGGKQSAPWIPRLLRGLRRALRRRWKAGLAAGAVISLPVAVGLATRTPLYRSAVMLRLNVDGQGAEHSGQVRERTHRMALLTRSYQEYFFDRIDPRDQESFQHGPREGRIWAAEFPGSHLIRVVVQGPNSILVSRLANQYGSFYADYVAFREREQLRSQLEVLVRREAEVRLQAEQSREELNLFLRESHATESSATASQRQELQARRAEAARAYTAVESVLLKAEKVRESPMALLEIAEFTAAPTVVGLHRAVVQLREDHAEALLASGEHSPGATEAAGLLHERERALEAELRRVLEELEGTRASASQELKTLDAALRKLNATAFKKEGEEARYATLTVQVESDERLHQVVRSKQMEIKLALGLPVPPVVTIEDDAVPALKPDGPWGWQSVGLSALVFGATFLLVPVFLERGSRLEFRALGKLAWLHGDLGNELQRIPALPTKGRRQLLVESFAPGVCRDAFCHLSQELEEAFGGQRHQCLLVTSPLEGEGKSFVAAGLAATTCSLGRRTLLVDCHLDSPTVSLWYPQVAPEGGLLEWLKTRGEGKVLACQRVGEGGPGELYVVASRGWSSDSAFLLGQACFQAWLRRAREEFDLVILDGPEVGEAGDIEVLARLADGIVLVSDPGLSTLRQLGKASRALDHVGGNLLGVIGNRQEPASR